MEGLSAVQAAAAVAIGGSVLAIAVPSFVANLHASRMAEAVDGLKRIGTSAVAVATLGTPPDRRGTFPAGAPLTPASVPRGAREKDPPGSWDHPTWRALDFSIDHAHAFSFGFDVSTAADGASRFVAHAHGDLDGDGVTSTFEVEGVAVPGGARLAPGLYVEREVE